MVRSWGLEAGRVTVNHVEFAPSLSMVFSQDVTIVSQHGGKGVKT